LCGLFAIEGRDGSPSRPPSTVEYEPDSELRPLAQISADILALEEETEGLMSEITKEATG
jgi:hypothetical protein